MSGRAATDTVIPGRHALSVGHPQTETPRGWSWLPLGELATMGTGHTPSRSVSAYWDGDVQWMGIRDARAHHGGQIWNTAQTITQAGLDNSSARLLPAGTVALSRTASVGYVVQLGREMATSQDFVTWTCSAALDPLFLMRTIQAEGDDIRDFGEGSTHTTIYFPELKALHVRTPPVPEQRRIVGKIDRLSARSKRARGELERANILSASYRQVILDAAVDGKLTSDWRAAHAVKRSGWERTILRDIVSTTFDGPFGSNLKSSDYTENGVRVVRLENIKSGWFDLEKQTFISLEKYDGLRRHTLLPNDVMVSSFVDGAVRACLIPEHFELSINKADCFCVRSNTGRLLPKYALYVLLGSGTLEDVLEMVHGATRARISLSQLKSIEIRLPTISEQHEIVRRIEHAFAAIDRLAAEAMSAQKLLDRLDQAVLAKAFRGELVPQDPNDEPASVLLERIRADRAAAPAPKRGRKPKTIKA